MLTRQEKEKLVIDLYKQEKTIREIAKQVHLSFTDISAIIRKEFGPREEQKYSVELSKDTQALKLFAKGEKPLDVAIKFNIAANDVQRLHRGYRDLCGMHELNKIYNEFGDEIESFIQLYRAMKKQHLSLEEITNTVRYANDLPILELRYEKVKEQVDHIESKKQNLLYELQNLENATAVSNKVIANLDKVLEYRRNKVESLDSEIQKLQNKILWMMGSKEYTKIRDIARQQVETFLGNRKTLFDFMLFAVIHAIRLYPDKQLLIFDNENIDNQSYYMEQHRRELYELAEVAYAELAKELVKVTIESTPPLKQIK